MSGNCGDGRATWQSDLSPWAEPLTTVGDTRSDAELQVEKPTTNPSQEASRAGGRGSPLVLPQPHANDQTRGSSTGNTQKLADRNPGPIRKPSTRATGRDATWAWGNPRQEGVLPACPQTPQAPGLVGRTGGDGGRGSGKPISAVRAGVPTRGASPRPARSAQGVPPRGGPSPAGTAGTATPTGDRPSGWLGRRVHSPRSWGHLQKEVLPLSG